MNRDEIKQTLIDMIKNLFPNIEVDNDIVEYVDFIDDLGMDSITFISIVVEVEDIFAITVPDDMLLMENFRNVDRVAQIIEQNKNIEQEGRNVEA